MPPLTHPVPLALCPGGWARTSKGQPAHRHAQTWELEHFVVLPTPMLIITC